MAAIYLTMEHARWFDMARRMMEGGIDPLTCSFWEAQQRNSPYQSPAWGPPDEYGAREFNVNAWTETIIPQEMDFQI